jgi:hypothetical protein
MASAHDLPVIPHGVGAPTYHFVMATPNSPRAEFVDIFARGGNSVLKGEPAPKNGYWSCGTGRALATNWTKRFWKVRSRLH